MIKYTSSLVSVLIVLAFMLWYYFKKGISKVDSSGATISDEQANIYADQLFGAMDEMGTDENIIVSIFQKITSDDFKLIYQKFGKQPYFLNGGLPILGESYDLVKWLQTEFGNVNSNVTNIIRNAGFVYN